MLERQFRMKGRRASRPFHFPLRKTLRSDGCPYGTEPYLLPMTD